MASGDELVKYITERVVTFMETPKEERRRHTKPKEPWTAKWFGMIPLGLSLMKKQSPKRKSKS
ncbi:YqzE family protein [Paenibacillus sp. HJL G12]|uniref:YqzE family protein n=1 Tax=Paenibacillus dendrobii TaxID=2691084 RepID=A0A7X3LFK4_9BACL|nr:YqzE family protein [Paenibacillus dendrobii]MWV43761.1 YqzE family protein [Paenibacillus dendrobii]